MSYENYLSREFKFGVLKEYCARVVRLGKAEDGMGMVEDGVGMGDYDRFFRYCAAYICYAERDYVRALEWFNKCDRISLQAYKVVR